MALASARVSLATTTITSRTIIAIEYHYHQSYEIPVIVFPTTSKAEFPEYQFLQYPLQEIAIIANSTSRF